MKQTKQKKNKNNGRTKTKNTRGVGLTIIAQSSREHLQYDKYALFDERRLKQRRRTRQNDELAYSYIYIYT